LQGHYPHFGSQKDAGERYVQYFKDFLKTDYMIGYNHCELVDVKQGNGIKQGFYSTGGVPYAVMQEHVHQANQLIADFVEEQVARKP